ncbi:MAG TPA: lipoate--protein ligase family protein [Pirellulales bacterium]|nr:lipoate--protein ligase family protein [Pirellulales bacterium]
MFLLDLTLPTATENVALDEALLEEAEARPGASELLRLWEPPSPLVVIGRSSRPEVEVDLQHCQRLGIPVVRRTSGGAAIITGPGCLMYAVVLSTETRAELKSVDAAHGFVLRRLIEGLKDIAPVAARCGTSDLAMEVASRPAGDAQHTAHAAAKKFSGNSLRVKRRHLLYHGTLLFDFDLELISRCLKHPPREPDYRQGRPHATFVSNLPATRAQLRAALRNAWQATEPFEDWPRDRTTALVSQKYARDEWNRFGQA